MPSRADFCDDRQLQLLLAGRLDEIDEPTAEAHLATCTRCQARVDELTEGSDWHRRLRVHLSDSGRRALDLETLPVKSRAPVSLDFLAPTDDPLSLGRLGLYEVTGVIGQGGNGIVLKAIDPVLRRPVAIKVLAAALAACGSARRRFGREARAAAAVVHEHVVPVHAINEDADRPYLVMTYVPGCSLQERLDRDGPLELREILRIAIQAAAGLAAAHAQGLVHRDVKPANILLENDVERVQITDFGLARAADDASMTHSGILAGTPPYMAPEQARGEAIDHRADLFSLGSTLYAMCTGRAPFRAETAIGVLRRVMDEQPPPIRQSNPDIPEWLVAIVRRLHAKDPARRFSSAGGVADLLRRCLAHIEHPDTEPLPAIAGYTPSSQRRRLNRIAVCGSFLALAACAVWQTATRPGDGSRDEFAANSAQPVGTRTDSGHPPAQRHEPDRAVAVPSGLVQAEEDSELTWNAAELARQLRLLEASWHATSATQSPTSPDPLDDIRAQVRRLQREVESGAYSTR